MNGMKGVEFYAYVLTSVVKIEIRRRLGAGQGYTMTESVYSTQNISRQDYALCEIMQNYSGLFGSFLYFISKESNISLNDLNTANTTFLIFLKGNELNV